MSFKNLKIFYFLNEKMVTEIKCNFTLKNSNKIKDIGFEGCNEVQLNNPIKIECSLGVEKTLMEISQIEKEKYEIKIKSSFNF